MGEAQVSYPTDGLAVVVLTGDHDRVNATELRDALGAAVAGNDAVVVDVTAATFVDSSFLHTLAFVGRAAQTRGTRFAVRMDEGCVAAKPLEVSGVLRSLELASAALMQGLAGGGARAASAVST